LSAASHWNRRPTFTVQAHENKVKGVHKVHKKGGRNQAGNRIREGSSDGWER